jgi:LuxR family transcriptional regulator, maltose regulon positive regulatory protein
VARVSVSNGGTLARTAGPTPWVSGNPPSTIGLVRRPRLLEMLEQDVPIILVSGPAGGGKTLLVASWLREHQRRAGSVAWVSVEPDLRDATAFWVAVLNALRASGVAARAKALRTLIPTPHGAGDGLAGQLGEGLRALRTPVLIVLDDVHNLESHEALDTLAALLADRPPQLRVVLITRRVPELGLHRLRLAGALAEIGAPELAFTVEEAGALLADAGITVSEHALAALRDRTEGWAAGLRLAAMSLAGGRDPDSFVAEFSGSNRRVAEYFRVEVLASQLPAVRRLLLRTSMLERVNGPLANLLAGEADGERLLRSLEDANAFVASVDARRSWFRYHPLLAELLRVELQGEAPEQVEALHRTAAHWYEAHGFAVEAIRHAQAGQDWDHARDLLAHHWFSLFLDGRQATIRRLLSVVPAAVVRSDAELAALMAADRLAAGRLDDADAYIALAERLARSVPKQHRRRFEVTLAVVRLTRARTRGDFEATVKRARAILTPTDGQTWADVVSNEDLRALALLNLGYVEYWALRLEDAERHLQEGLALAREIGRPYVALGCLGPLAHIANMEPRLGVGEERSRQAIELADRLGWSDDPIVGAAYVALGGGLVSRGRLKEGEFWLDRGKQVLDRLPDPEGSVSLPYAQGVLRFVQGRYQEAIACFSDAVERPHGGVPAPHFLSMSARSWELRARLHLGDTESARAALADADDAQRGLVDWCNLAARLRLAEDRPQAAVEALAPVLDGSAAAFHVNLEVEALVLESIARDRLGQVSAAEGALEHALDLAEPERQVWTFFTHPDAQGVLKRPLRHRTAHGTLIDELLDQLAGAATSGRAGATADLREPLTERELTVLRLLATNLTAAEIGSELRLSFHTVKSHMRRIYAKLDAHRRGEAVERARALGLLAEQPKRL